MGGLRDRAESTLSVSDVRRSINGMVCIALAYGLSPRRFYNLLMILHV
jgi:hypothetical protein